MSTVADHDMKELSTLAEARVAFMRQLSPKLMLAAATTTLAARIVLGAFAAPDVIAVVGTIVFWCLFEWGAHVVLLHAKPRRVLGFEVDPLYARVHRAHHEAPWRLDRVLVPARFIVAAFFVTGVLALGVASDIRVGLSAWSTFCFAALAYEWTHFLVHTRHKPRTTFFRAIWRNHRLHHFKNENYWFGLSTTLTDRVFGTDPEPNDVPTSGTTRTLGQEET
jgi:hypothetical protein